MDIGVNGAAPTQQLEFDEPAVETLTDHKVVGTRAAIGGVSGYLASLNTQQRLAVEHGIGTGDSSVGGPLLVIAGAGSGKTNTLAYRVAHLVANGADPQRILLLTFTRRAAAEMERRAGQLLSRVLGAGRMRQPPELSWAGTFHGVGARLLREYAPRIGLHSGFTILDRGDAEDLLALVRHQLGLSATEKRFPTKGTCLAIYSRVVNGAAPVGEVLERLFPWCAAWEARAEEGVLLLCRGEAEAERARL